MTQVLQYGIPKAERLQCEHPTCETLATLQVRYVGTDESKFCCRDHLGNFTGNPTKKIRLVHLRKPGERNPEPQQL